LEAEAMSTGTVTEKTIRVYLANQPKLLRQMLRRAIQRIPDIEIVGESSQLHSIQQLQKAETIDWLIVSLTDQGKIPSHFLHMMERKPSIKVLGISPDGNELALQDVATGEKRQLRNASLTMLISLLQNRYLD
jgi:DNA-binding NarL/FixJ family response regulator